MTESSVVFSQPLGPQSHRHWHDGHSAGQCQREHYGERRLHKTTASTALYSSGTLTLAGGGTVSAGQLNLERHRHRRAGEQCHCLDHGGGGVNGPLTNFATVNVNGSVPLFVGEQMDVFIEAASDR